MRLTIIHPSIGRRVELPYIKSWQMQPLQVAVLTGLTPSNIEIKFYDDRIEEIPYNEPTDMVAISVETYTAKRAYQIANHYRQQRVSVIMGGFHATLQPEEVALHADAVIIGEVENIWLQVLDDVRKNSLKSFYQSKVPTSMQGLKYDRSVFNDKKYLPITLIEAGRGCKYHCEFCAIQAFYQSTYRMRPVEDIVSELAELKAQTKLFFFVDDNFAGNIPYAKKLLKAMVPLGILWVTQLSIDAGKDAEFVELLALSGCVCVLVGLESMNITTLKIMDKQVNASKRLTQQSLSNFKHHKIGIYATFVFGYDGDQQADFDQAVKFSQQQGFFIAAFNHLTPFPGTPLYQRLKQEKRLIYDSWWLNENYRYNQIPFVPQGLTSTKLKESCVAARREFYSVSSIVKRFCLLINRSNWFMLKNFFSINLLHRMEISQRNNYPLGSEEINTETYTVKEHVVKASFSDE